MAVTLAIVLWLSTIRSATVFWRPRNGTLLATATPLIMGTPSEASAPLTGHHPLSGGGPPRRSAGRWEGRARAADHWGSVLAGRPRAPPVRPGCPDSPRQPPPRPLHRSHRRPRPRERR